MDRAFELTLCVFDRAVVLRIVRRRGQWDHTIRIQQLIHGAIHQIAAVVPLQYQRGAIAVEQQLQMLGDPLRWQRGCDQQFEAEA